VTPLDEVQAPASENASSCLKPLPQKIQVNKNQKYTYSKKKFFEYK